MRLWPILCLVMFSVSVLAADEPPVLPHGLGFRIAGQKETASDKSWDLLYTREGIAETSLPGELKAKLDVLLKKAVSELQDKTPDEAAVIRQRLEKEAATLLSPQQRQEIQRRAIIAFAELFVLGNGMEPEEINDKLIKTFGLTGDQAKRIRETLAKLSTEIDNVDSIPRFEMIAAARKKMRSILTDAQRAKLDETVEKAIKKAGEESSAGAKKQ